MTVPSGLAPFFTPQEQTVLVTEFVAATGTQTVAGVKTFSSAPVLSAGLRTKQAVDDVHDTAPTAASLTTAFGSPATLGRGFVATVDDADGDTNGYLVFTSDASWYFLKFTKAS